MNSLNYITDIMCIPSQGEYDAIKELIEEEKGVIGSVIKGSMETKPGKVMFLDFETFAAVICRSGFGAVATSLTIPQLLKEYGTKLERIYLVGTSGGKDGGIYKVENSYNEVDLRPLGYAMGESPDMPLSYKTDDDLFGDLQKANSLTVSRFVIDFPDTSLYLGMNKLPQLIDMEDYQFMASTDGRDIKRYIIRGVSDAGSGDDWQANTKRVMKEIWNIFLKIFDRE